MILSSSDYYAFGSNMPGRKYAGIQGYRYDFNGKELDKEDGFQDYGMRIYYPAIGKFLSVDPISKSYPELTPYQFASNTPVWAIDLDGLENYPTSASDGYLTMWKAFDAWCDKPAGNNSWCVGEAAGGVETETNGQVLWASLGMGMRNMSSGGGYKGIGASANRYRSPVTNKSSVITTASSSAVKVKSATSVQVHDNTTPPVVTAKVAGGSKDQNGNTTGAGLSKLKNQINPDNGTDNCVLCTANFQKKIETGVIESTTLSGPDKAYSNTFKTFFPNTTSSYAYGYSGLTLHLQNSSSTSLMIVAKLKNAAPSYNAHAFNAVKNKNGSWKFIDTQSGTEYSQEYMEKTFGRYEVFETNTTTTTKTKAK